MNIEPPGALEWGLLLLVGALAGAINALRGYATPGKADRLILGAAEGATALFVTVTTFLILEYVYPVITGHRFPAFGSIGLAGLVAHFGLRQSIQLARRIVGQDKD